MIDKTTEQLLLAQLSRISRKPIRDADTLFNLDAAELLRIIDRMDDRVLPILVQLFKSSDSGVDLFHKLMGNHEEDNRILVNRFFERYMSVILSDDSISRYFNPLAVYLPQETWCDLGFLQSRQHFFLRQTIQCINEFFDQMFDAPPIFEVGQQEDAWNWFWSKVCETH
jgi:hypothetical protein